MKLTVFILFLSLMQVSATVYSQATLFSFQAENKQVVDVLRQIEESSNFRFFFLREQVDVERKVSVKAREATVEQILKELFKDQPVSYEFANEALIVLTRDDNSLGSIKEYIKNNMQQRTITGNITDTDGLPLPGVTVLLKGTTQGTVTNADGNYSLSNIPENAMLVFSFVGMQTQEVEVGSQTNIDVTMAVDAIGIEEVVAIGYGTVRKEDLTSSVSSVAVEEALSPANASVSNLIQGRASGVNATTLSAQPGSTVDIRIRGASSSPLYVIDGVPISNNASLDPGLSGTGYSGGVDRDYLATINPEDIESITILKDASSTAIYGSAAANGVILIKTKGGKAGDVSVAYSGSYSIQTDKPYYPLMNASNFMQQHNRLWFERYLYNNSFAPYGPTQYAAGFTPTFSDSEVANAGEGTDWLGLVTRTGSIQQHNISLSGGSEKVKTFASFNYYDNKGILKNSDYKRYTGRMNFDYSPKSWLKVGTSLSYTSTRANNSSTSFASGPETFNQILAAVQFAPNVPYDSETFDIAMKSPYDPQLANPISYLHRQDDSYSSRIFATPNLEISILPSLKLKVQTGYDASSFERYFYLPGEIEALLSPNGLANNKLNKNYNLSSEEFLTYTTNIGSSHSINIVAGVGYYKSGSEGFGVNTYGFFTDAFGYNNIGIASEQDRTGYSSFKYENTKISQFARINYSIADKYLITLTARRDGSSTFAEGKKYGFFPGASIAWKMEEEQFIKNVDAISQLKLRIGYGETGNERIVGNYPLTLYGTEWGFRYVQDGTTYNGVSLNQIGNPNITWETDIMTNIGLDFGFLKNRFYGTIDLYSKTLKDLLQFDPLPANSALSSIANNVGSTKAQGFDFNLSSRFLTGKFRWTNELNISYVKVNWIERNLKQPLDPWENEDDNVDVIYGWKTDGIISSASDIPSYMPDAIVGNIKFIDINNDGVLDAEDVVNLGNWDPRWNIGMTNKFNFMNLDFSIFIYSKFGNQRTDGYAGNDKYNNYYSWDRIAGGANGNRIYNSAPFAKDIWTHDNPDGIYPGVADNPYSGNNPAGNTNFYLLDNSFIRIKNMELGYALPQSLLNNSGFFKSVRLYMSVDNIAVITSWKGLDPEIEEPNPYPQVLTTSFGVNVNF